MHTQPTVKIVIFPQEHSCWSPFSTTWTLTKKGLWCITGPSTYVMGLFSLVWVLHRFCIVTYSRVCQPSDASLLYKPWLQEYYDLSFHSSRRWCDSSLAYSLPKKIMMYHWTQHPDDVAFIFCLNLTYFAYCYISLGLTLGNGRLLPGRCPQEVLWHISAFVTLS